MIKTATVLYILLIPALLLAGCLDRSPGRSVAGQAVGQVTPPPVRAASPAGATTLPTLAGPTPAGIEAIPGGLYQAYFNETAGLSLLIPVDWQVSEPEQTPLGQKTLLGPPPLAEDDPATSAIVVADAAEISPVEALDRLCAGACPQAQLQDAVLGGQAVQVATVSGSGRPPLAWYFVERNGRLVYFSLHHPQTLEPLYGVLDTLTFGPTPTGPTTIPQAQVAQQALAEQLGLSPYVIAVQSAGPAEWLTTCLGLPFAGEECLKTVTPGTIGMLEVQARQLFEYRVSQDGRIVKLTPGAALAAVQVLAQQLGLNLDQVEIVNVEPAEWPTACLGLPTSGELCPEIVTPGYSVTLLANGQSYVYHSDETGGNLRLAEAPEPDTGSAAIIWTREADGCATALISPEAVTFGPCDGPLLPAGQFQRNARPEELAYFLETYAPFEADTPAGYIVFNGQGQAEAAPAEQRQIAEWSRLVYMEAEAGRSGASWGLAIGWAGQAEEAERCLNLEVYVTGAAFASSYRCGGGDATDLGQGRLDAGQLARLYEWLDRLESFEITGTDPALAAPTTYLVFSGTGPAQPGAADKEAIQAFAAGLFEELGR